MLGKWDKTSSSHRIFQFCSIQYLTLFYHQSFFGNFDLNSIISPPWELRPISRQTNQDITARTIRAVIPVTSFLPPPPQLHDRLLPVSLRSPPPLAGTTNGAHLPTCPHPIPVQIGLISTDPTSPNGAVNYSVPVNGVYTTCKKAN